MWWMNIDEHPNKKDSVACLNVPSSERWTRGASAAQAARFSRRAVFRKINGIAGDVLIAVYRCIQATKRHNAWWTSMEHHGQLLSIIDKYRSSLYRHYTITVPWSYHHYTIIIPSWTITIPSLYSYTIMSYHQLSKHHTIINHPSPDRLVPCLTLANGASKC